MERRSERIFGQRYGGNRPVRIADLNAHLMCVLCCGYYIDATTIIECLHSFCRTCIVKYLEKSSRCPVCNIVVHKAQPLLNIRLDHVLQGLVYKLVPGLLMKEMNDRRNFYSRGLPSKTKGQAKETTLTSSILSDQSGQKLTTSTKPASADSECFSISLEYCPRFRPVPCFDDDVTNTSDINGQFIDVRYLLCPAAFTVGCLKKFIRAKFDLPLVYQVCILYNDEHLDNHLSMLDIAFIFQWQKRAPLKLFYSVSSTPNKKRKFWNEIPFEDQDETSPKKQNKGVQRASSSHCDHSQMPLSSSLEKRATQSSTRSVQTDSLQRMSGATGLKVAEHTAGVFPEERLLDSSGMKQNVVPTKDVYRNDGRNLETNQELSKSNPKTVRSMGAGELTVKTAHGNVDATVVHKPVDGRPSHNAVTHVGNISRKRIESENVKQLNAATNTTTSVSSDAEFVIDLTQDGTDSPVSAVVPPMDPIVGPNALSTMNCSVSNSHVPGSIGFLGDNCTALYDGGGTWGMNLSQLAEKSFAALPCINTVNSMKTLSCGLQNHLPYLPGSGDSLMPSNVMKILPSPEMAIVPSFGVQILYSDGLISQNPIYGVVQLAGAPAAVEFDPVAQGRPWGQGDLADSGIMNDADFQRLCEGKTEQEKNLLHNTRQYGQLMVSTVLDRTGRDATRATPESCTMSLDPSTSVPLPCMFTGEGGHNQQNCWNLFEPFKGMWDNRGSALPEPETMKGGMIPVENVVSESSEMLFPLKTSRELELTSNTQAQLNRLESGITDAAIDMPKSSGMAKSYPLELELVNVWGKERSTSDTEHTKTSGLGAIGLHVDCAAGDASGFKPESGRSAVLEQPTLENHSSQSCLQEHRNFEKGKDDSKFAEVCTVEPLTRSDLCASGPPKTDVFEEVSMQQLLPVYTSSGVAGTEMDGSRVEEGTTLNAFEAPSVKSSIVASPTELEIVDARIQSSVGSLLVDNEVESSVENVQKWAEDENQIIGKLSRIETEPGVQLVESKTDMILNSDDVVAVESSIETAHKETDTLESLVGMTKILPVELEVKEPKVFKLEACSVRDTTTAESGSIEAPKESACLFGNAAFVDDEIASSADNCNSPFVQEAKNEDSEYHKLCKKEIKEFQSCAYSEAVLQSSLIESPVSKREELTLDQSIEDFSSPVTDDKNVIKEVPDLFGKPNVTLNTTKLKELDDSDTDSCCHAGLTSETTENTCLMSFQIATDSQVEKSEENGDLDLQGFSCDEANSGSSLSILVNATVPVSLSSSSCCNVVNVDLQNPHHVLDSMSVKDLVMQTACLDMSETMPSGNKPLAFESVSDMCGDISAAITEPIPMANDIVELERENASGLSGNEKSVCENFKIYPTVDMMEPQDAHEIEFDCTTDGSSVKEEEVNINKIPISDIMEDVSAHDASDHTYMNLEVSLLVDQKQESTASENSDKMLQNKGIFINESEESELNIIAENEMSDVGHDAFTSFMTTINSPFSADENCNEMSSVENPSSSAVEIPNSVVPLSCPIPCSTNSPNINSLTCELPASSVIDTGDQIMGSNVLFIIDDNSDLDSSKIFPLATESGNTGESIFLSSDNMSETVLSTSVEKTLPVLCADSLILQSLQNCVNEAVISSFNGCVDIVQVETASNTEATDCMLLTLEDASPLENSFGRKIESCEADTIDVADGSCIRNDSELPLCDNEDDELCKTNVDLAGSQSEGGFSLINVLEFCDDTQAANARNDSGSGSLCDENNRSSVDDLDYCNLKLSHCFQFTQTEDGELDERCITNDDMGREETNHLNLQRLDSCFSTISRSVSLSSFHVNALSDSAFNLRVKRRRWNSVDEGMFARRHFNDGNGVCVTNPLPPVKLQQDKEIEESGPFIESTIGDKTVGDGSLPSITGCDSEDNLLLGEDISGLTSFCEDHGQISVMLHDGPPLDFAGETSAAGNGVLANNCSNICFDSCELETDLQDRNEKSCDLDFSKSMKTEDKIVNQNPGI